MKRVAIAILLLPAALLVQAAQADSAQAAGAARLTISVSGSEFLLVLEVPSADIMGAAGESESGEQRDQVATAMSRLSDPLTLFVPPSEAGCMTASANVALTGDTFGQSTGVFKATNGSGTRFQAEYMIQCQSIEALDRLSFRYFEHFQNTQALTVHYSSGGESDMFEVLRASPVLTLSQTP